MIEFSTGVSILFYALFFLIALGWMYCAEKSKHTGNQILYLIAVLLTLSLPAMLRYKVGIDFEFYLEWAEQIKAAPNLQSALTIADVEASFVVLMYGSYRLFGTAMAGFAFYGLFTQLFMVLGIWSFRKKASPTISLLIYLTTFYLRTYNIMRQALAVAIVFFALQYLLNKQYKKYILYVLIAMLFHTTAITALVLLWYYRPREYKKKWHKAAEYLLPVVGLLFIELLMKIVFSISIFAQYRVGYDKIYDNSIFTIGTFLLFIKFGLYIGYRMLHRIRPCVLKPDIYTDMLDKAMICDVVFTLMNFKILYAARVGLFFTMPAFIGLSYIWGKSIRKTGGFSIYQLYTLFYTAVLFASSMLSNGYGQLPYRFGFY